MADVVADIQNLEEDSSTSNSTEPNGGVVIIELEGLIKNHIASIERVTNELRKHREMLDDIFNNDATFKEHSEKAKEANKIKSATKQQIMKQPQVADLSDKVKSMRTEVKELKEALSDYLREYQRLSGVNEIEGDDGQIHEIVYIAKLIRKFMQR